MRKHLRLFVWLVYAVCFRLMDNFERLQQDVNELTRRVNAGLGNSERSTLNAPTQNQYDPQPVAVAPAKPSQDQQDRNGDESYSVNGYLDTVAAPGTDKVKESAWWYSNDSVVAGQALSQTNAETSSINQTLKQSTHSHYDPAYCDWDSSGGFARMTGVKSLDAPFPASPVYPGRTEYLGAIIARRDATIVIPNDCHLGAYLYQTVGGSEDIIKASASTAPTATVRGTPAVTTDRKYKIFTRTDKGLTFLSAERDVPAAPSDADFATCDVYLTWEAYPGAIEYHIYRHDITAAKYRELLVISSGATAYADNNSQINSDTGGYPAATYDRAICYTATSDGDLSNLPINGVALKWADVFLNILVPGAVATLGAGFQWLRLQLDKAMDRQMVDVASTAGSKRVSSATGAFAARDTGRTATLFAADGVTVLHGPEAITFVDATHVDFASNVATNNANVILYIVGGGDHGLLVDMIHIGYIERAKFAHYADDTNRTLPPQAAPNSSSQGGVGDGGGSGDPGDGGIGGCVALDAPVTMLLGNGYLALPAKEVRRGWMLKSGNLQPNMVLDRVLSDCDNLWIVRTGNGLELPCSPRQVVFSSFQDQRGSPLNRLQVGDLLLTCRDGNDEVSPISEIIQTGMKATVVTYALTPGHKYLAGYVRRPCWHRFARWLLRRKDRKPNGLYSHNRKLEE